MPTTREQIHRLLADISKLNDQILELDPDDPAMAKIKSQIAALQAKVGQLDLMEQGLDRERINKAQSLKNEMSMLQDMINVYDEMQFVEGKDVAFAAKEAREKMQRLLYELRDLGEGV